MTVLAVLTVLAAGEHLALLLQVLQNTGQSDDFGGFGGFGRDGYPLTPPPSKK